MTGAQACGMASAIGLALGGAPRITSRACRKEGIESSRAFHVNLVLLHSYSLAENLAATRSPAEGVSARTSCSGRYN